MDLSPGQRLDAAAAVIALILLLSSVPEPSSSVDHAPPPSDAGTWTVTSGSCSCSTGCVTIGGTSYRWLPKK